MLMCQRIESSFMTCSLSICWRKSGPASKSNVVSSVSRRREVLSLLSCESVERQVLHSQAITGTPCDVPVPRKVIFTLEIFPDKPILKINNRQQAGNFLSIQSTVVYLLYLSEQT